MRDGHAPPGRPLPTRPPAPPAGAARLTTQQERELVIAVQTGDLEACRQLVEAFLPPIAALARRYPPGIGIERQELIQEGVAGLLFATRRYDPDRGTPFWAYATYRVRKAMQDLVAELTMPLALSDRAVRGLATIRAARRDHSLRHGTEATTRELARETGLGRDQIARLQAAARAPRSVEEPPGEDWGDAAAGQIRDLRAENAFEQVLDAIEVCEVQHLADGLAERERAVLRAHYGLGAPAQTLQQIGQGLGLTAERARQIECGALRKLRAALAQPASGSTTASGPARPRRDDRPRPRTDYAGQRRLVHASLAGVSMSS